MLSLLNQQQMNSHDKSHTYTLPNITRWTAHFHSFSGLLADCGPLQATVALNRDQLLEIGKKHPIKTTRIISNVEEPVFWKRLDE